jgi:hypothetical protein
MAAPKIQDTTPNTTTKAIWKVQGFKATCTGLSLHILRFLGMDMATSVSTRCEDRMRACLKC